MTMGRIEDVSEADFWRILDVNLAGVFHCARACVPHMREAGHGRIVAISSEWGQIGWPRATAYSASKAGIISMVKAFARQLGASGITANVVAPGAIDTEQLGVDAEDAGETLDELRRRYAAEAPLGRLGTPRDVACAVASWPRITLARSPARCSPRTEGPRDERLPPRRRLPQPALHRHPHVRAPAARHRSRWRRRRDRRHPVRHRDDATASARASGPRRCATPPCSCGRITPRWT